MIKEICKKLFPSKDELLVPKEYLEVLESLYEACRPLTFDSRLTEQEIKVQRTSIQCMAYRCLFVIKKLRDERKLP